MTERRIDRLLEEIGLASIPHDRAEETQICGRQRPPIDRHDPALGAGQTRRGIGVAPIRVRHFIDLKFHRRLHRQPDSDQPLGSDQAVGRALRVRGRHIGRGARGAVDKAEQRIVGIRVKPRLRVLCAESPAILRFVAGEAGAPVAPEILEERIARRLRRPVWLKRRDHAARIGVRLKLWDDRRRRLRAPGWIRKEAEHFLLVGDFARDGGGGGWVGRAIGPCRVDGGDEHGSQCHARKLHPRRGYR